MPQIVDVNGVGKVSFPDDMSMDAINQALDKEYGGKEEQPKVSALGAAARSFLTSAGPTAVGMAAAEPLMGPATVLAPETFGLSYLAPLAVGAVAGGLAGWVQHKGIQKFAPGLEKLQQADVEQQKLASMGGRLAGVLPSAAFQPGQSVKALASIPAALRGATPAIKEAAQRQVMGLVGNVGLQEAITAGQTGIMEHRLPTGEEAAEAGLAGVLFGRSRFKPKEVTRAALSPEQRSKNEASFDAALQTQGQKIRQIHEGAIPGHPNNVMHVHDDGSVEVSRALFHDQLEKQLAQGKTVDEGIATMVEEEAMHSKVPDEVALKFWESMTPAEQWMARRRYHGPGMAGRQQLSPTQYGHEALRFWMQKAKSEPTEYVFGSHDERQASKLLTGLESAIRGTREALGTKASQAQKESLQQMLDNVKVSRENILKGVKDARSKQEAATADGNVPTQPVQGPREMPVAKGRPGVQPQAEGGLEESQKVLLKKQHEVIEGLEPDEYIIESAVMKGGGGAFGKGQPVYGPHHPGILKEIGGEELVKQHETRESRENDSFGYRTNLRPFVSRMSLMVRKTGRVPHSDDIPSMMKGETTVSEQPKTASVPLMVTREQRQALADLGYKKERIDQLTPEQVQEILQANKTAPPSAQPPGAPPAPEAKGKPTVGAATPAPAPAAIPPISQTVGSVNHPELQQVIRRQVELQRQPFSIAKVREMQKLGAREAELKEQLGLSPKRQGEVKGMAAKGRGEEPDSIPGVSAMGIQRGGKYQLAVRLADGRVVSDPNAGIHALVLENQKIPRDQWEHILDAGIIDTKTGEYVKDPQSQIKPDIKHREKVRVAKELGGEWKDTRSGRDFYEFQVDDQHREQVVVPEGSGREVIQKKIEASRARFADEGKPPVAQLGGSALKNKMGDPLGTTYHSTPEDWAEWNRLMRLPMDNPTWAAREQIKNKYGGMPPAAPKEPSAMAHKGEPLIDEETALRRIVTAIKGKVEPANEGAVVNEVANVLVNSPRESWGKLLTEFEGQMAEAKEQTAKQKLAARKDAAARAAAEELGVKYEGDLFDPEFLKSFLPDITTKGLDAGIIYDFNRDPTVVEGGKGRKVKQQMGGRKGEEVVVSKFREPAYDYTGRWSSVWKRIQNDHPEIPEWLARSRYLNRLGSFLAYASSDKIKKLLIAARAEKQFLGSPIVTTEGGEQVVRYPRTIPEPDFEPALRDMEKAPSPGNINEFEHFANAKGLTVEKAKQLLAEYKELKKARAAEKILREEEVAKIRGRELESAFKVSAQEGERVLKQQKEIAAQERKLEKDRQEYEMYNRRRRQKAIAHLQKWLSQESLPPERAATRPSINFDDVWFDHPRGLRGYHEFTPKQGEDAVYLKQVLGKGSQVEGKTASKLMHGVTIVVDKETGTVSALSTYFHPDQKQPRIYNPVGGAAGAKGKGYISVNELLANKFRVKGYMLAKDPLSEFQQIWGKEEGGRSAEEVFDDHIGKQAEAQSRGRIVALDTLLHESPTPVTQEEGGVGEEVTPISQASLEAWMRGPGAATWGMFGTDPHAMIRGPITSIEADAIYNAFKENKVQSVDDWSRVFGRMASDRRIAAAADKKQKDLRALMMLRGRDYAFLSAIEKIARKRYLELVRGTGHHAPDPVTGIPDPDHAKFAEAMGRYPRLPMVAREKGRWSLLDTDAWSKLPPQDKANYHRFGDVYSNLKPEQADELFGMLGEDQQLRFRLVEHYRENELLNALQYAYETAREVQAEHGGTAGTKFTEGELSAPEDVVAFRQRAIADYGDTVRRDAEQDALRKTVSRQYTGRPVPRELGPAPEPGTRITARGLTRQVPEYLEKGTTKIPGPQRWFLRDRIAAMRGGKMPPLPTAFGGITGEQFVGTEREPREMPQSTLRLMQERAMRGWVPGQPHTDPVAYQQWLARAYRLNDPAKRDPLGMTHKGYGVADVYRREMAEQGRVAYDPKDPNQAPMMTKEQEINMGRTLVLNGQIRPIAEMEQAKRSGGYMTWESAAAFRYHGYKLQQMADALREQKAPKGQIDEAQKMSDDWQKDIDSTAKQQFARTGHVLQGWNQIGPNDMQSTTFVRRMYRRARAEAEGFEDEDMYEMTPEDEKLVQDVAARMRAASKGVATATEAQDAAAAQAAAPKMDEGNQALVKQAEKIVVDTKQSAMSRMRSRGQSSGGPLDVQAMALRAEGPEGERPPLSQEDAQDLVDVGGAIMAELSANNRMTDSNWLAAMREMLHSPEVNRPDLEPQLEHIRALAEHTREVFLNNVIGTGDPVKDAREHFTRKQPPIEESIEAIARALAYDPHATKITPMEAYHVWNYLRLRFFNAEHPEWDIRTIRTIAGEELGVDANRLFMAMSSNRSMREPTEELLKQMRNEQRVRSQATNWLKNLQYPGWFRGLRVAPRLFFFDKILGHGLVPMITHASNMMFNPYAWSVYFGGKGQRSAWAEMYRMSFLGGEFRGQKLGASDYHAARMQEMMAHIRFEFWKRAGLEHDPFKYTDDYMIEGLYNFFDDKGLGGRALAKVGIPGSKFLQGLIGGRGFDALKTLRYARAEQWLMSMPEHLRTPEMAKLIADSVNHATGIVKKNFGEAGNWLLFAPKLEASRWAWLFRDTIKAADYLRRGNTTAVQRAWAISELKQKGAILAMYFGTLAMNQAFLKMAGSDQNINVTDPTKPDFMQFKAAGFRVGVLSPIIGIFRLFANLMHDAAGERTKFEKLTTRQRSIGEHLFEYARGKASPIASFGLEAATAQSTYPARPLSFLPWSEGLTRRQRLAGVEPYELPEYAAETFAPIPLEEAIRETWGEMGVGKDDQNKWLRALIVAGTMSATGARVAKDIEE